MRFLLAIGLLLLMCNFTEAQQRHYNRAPSASAANVIYVPVYLPYPEVRVRRMEMPRPYFRSQPYRGGSANHPMPSVTKGRMTPDKMPKAFANPKLIINPFVDQTPYKGLGEQFIK